MNLIEPSFDATTFTKNRERLLKHGVGQALFGEVVLEAERQGLLSDDRFTVDGTLIEAAASLKCFVWRAHVSMRWPTCRLRPRRSVVRAVLQMPRVVGSWARSLWVTRRMPSEDRV